MKHLKAIVLFGCLFGVLVSPGDVATDYPVSENAGGRENIEWSTSYGYHLIDERKDLPRVLLIGDSICAGYQPEVRSMLEGKLNVTYWTSSYCVTRPAYLKFLAAYLEESEFAVIHINNGCHSFTTAEEDWERGLRAVFGLIREKQPKAKIVWRTTTPNRDVMRNAKFVRLNAIAAKVAAELGNIRTDDLFALMNPLDRSVYWVDNSHFTAAAITMQAKQVSAACLDACEDLGPAPVLTFE